MRFNDHDPADYTIYKANPYVNSPTEGYIAAINILAIEFLCNRKDKNAYDSYVKILNSLSIHTMCDLWLTLRSIGPLESMGKILIDGNFETMKCRLIRYLDEIKEDL